MHAIWALTMLLAQPSTTPVELDFEYYRTQVEPIFLEKRDGFTRCVVCHAGDERAAFLEGLAPGATTWSEEQSRRN